MWWTDRTHTIFVLLGYRSGWRILLSNDSGYNWAHRLGICIPYVLPGYVHILISMASWVPVLLMTWWHGNAFCMTGLCVRGIHRSLADYPYEGVAMRSFDISLVVRNYSWTNNKIADDLRHWWLSCDVNVKNIHPHKPAQSNRLWQPRNNLYIMVVLLFSVHFPKEDYSVKFNIR